jgi:hypothetical protein
MNGRMCAPLAGVAGFVCAVFGAGCGDDTGGTGGGSAEGGSISVQISGEELATDGFRFPTGSEVVIVDGWQIEFDHVLVALGSVSLSENPDKAPSDQSQTDAVVARKAGPWIVDLAQEGSVTGAGGEGTAVPLFTFDAKDDGSAFATDQRYALSYAFTEATSSATTVNLDTEGEAALADMIAGGYSFYFVGTATFVGTECQSSDASYDWSAVPTTVPLRLGFKTPVELVNCQNQDNQGEPFPDEEYQRGIAVKSNQTVTAQLTLHVDHPFYGDVEHEPELFFDQMAAQLVGQTEGTPLTLDLLAGVDPTAFVDGAGNPLPWRRCDGTAPASGQRAFDTGSIGVNPAGDPSSTFRDYRDYVHYVTSSMGHLNGGEGLCYVKRGYASPQ